MSKATHILSGAAALLMLLSISACGKGTTASLSSQSAGGASASSAAISQPSGDTSQLNPNILADMTLEQKAAQMIQGAAYRIDADDMTIHCYGSLLTGGGSNDTQAGWKETVLDLQGGALYSDLPVPFLFGTDAVHGVNGCQGAVIFPHNIGIGAANDEELTYQMGLAVADEAKLTGMLWSFSPCIAAAADPRWGRTYESYSSDTALVKALGTAFARGLIDGGILPCAKHFLGDGNTAYGTGENGQLLDRGDAQLSDEEIDAQLAVYQSLIDAGVKTVMVSHSSLNGVKMHENAHFITDVLKGEMGFEGFVVSDWESIHNLSVFTLKEQVIAAINAGIDMLMEPERYEDCRQYIVEAVREGSISQARVDDAVSRILTVKKEMGLFFDPMQEQIKTEQSEVGSGAYRELAQSLVEKSLVLLKNDGQVLPIKPGSKIFVTGPAANDTGVQCGGWTLSWLGMTDRENGGQRLVEGATTLLDGLYAAADEYDLTILTDEAQAGDADITLLVLGERPYAEWEGDTEDLSITGALGLAGNEEAIALAKELGKPTVACIVAGRNVLISDYLPDWDAAVMCYLPGSEGGGVANVLTGKSAFSGKLPMPWYDSVGEIGTDQCLFEPGYGLTY